MKIRGLLMRTGLLLCLWLSIVELRPPTRALAGGFATIQDSAALFTQAGAQRINQTASQANMHIVVVTSNAPFATKAAWQAFVHHQSTDVRAVTIGLLISRKSIFVVPGSQSGVTVAAANQAVLNARGVFNAGQMTEGVIQMIRAYRPGATYSTSLQSNIQPSTVIAPTTVVAQTSQSSSNPWPLIIVLLLVGLVAYGFIRRRMGGAGGFGSRPSMGGPFGNSGYNQNQGGYGQNQGGGFGSSMAGGALGGVVGGVAGAAIGNALFDHDGNQVGASGDPPLDTPQDQGMQGGWSGDAGGGDSGSGWSGDAGGGDSSGGSW